jgi:Holliday junction resolvase
MSGRRSRSKGLRSERGIVALLKARGIAAERVPLSGAVGGPICRPAAHRPRPLRRG